MRVETHSVDQTLALGQAIGRLAPALPAVTCIALDGPLGAGKTQLTRGIAQGAEVFDPSLVSSPTFVLMNIYEGPKPVHHLDAYRVHSGEDLAALGFEDIASGADGGGIIIVEWARRIVDLLPADTLWIEISHEGDAMDECRAFAFTPGGPDATQLLHRLEAAIATEPPDSSPPHHPPTGRTRSAPSPS